MTYEDWRQPTRMLHARTAPASEELSRVATLLRLRPGDDPHGVLSAKVEAALPPVLHFQDPVPATEKQLAYLNRLGPVDVEHAMPRTVTSACIDHYLSSATAHALEELEVVRGDRVHLYEELIDPSTGELMEGAKLVGTGIAETGVASNPMPCPPPLEK